MTQDKPIDRRIQRTLKLLLDSLIALILDGFDQVEMFSISGAMVKENVAALLHQLL